MLHGSCHIILVRGAQQLLFISEASVAYGTAWLLLDIGTHDQYDKPLKIVAWCAVSKWINVNLHPHVTEHPTETTVHIIRFHRLYCTEFSRSESYTKQSVYMSVPMPGWLLAISVEFAMFCGWGNFVDGLGWTNLLSMISLSLSIFSFILVSRTRMHSFYYIIGLLVFSYRKKIFLWTLSFILKRRKTQFLFQNQKKINLNSSCNN